MKSFILIFKGQTSEAEVPGSNPASPTKILMRCRIVVK